MKILELYDIVVESRKTEAQGLNILKRANIDNAEEVIKDIANGAVTPTGKYVAHMAYLYGTGETNLNNIFDIFKEYDKLVSKKRIKPVQVNKRGLFIGDNQFNDFIKFSEYIHGETNKYANKGKGSKSASSDFKSEKKPLWSGNNIDIYIGNNVGECIGYTMGGLTGKAYSFCIGQPGNTMYKSYRDSKASTFYFIVDKNRFGKNEDGSVNLDDPLHIVVFDMTNRGVELTDANNRTGNIAEYGSDSSGYVNYLKSKGVPVDKMVNKGKTPEEEKEDELLGKRNTDLKWFMDLSPEYKSAYIGRGHVLSNDQFDYLIS